VAQLGVEALQHAGHGDVARRASGGGAQLGAQHAPQRVVVRVAGPTRGGNDAAAGLLQQRRGQRHPQPQQQPPGRRQALALAPAQQRAFAGAHAR